MSKKVANLSELQLYVNLINDLHETTVTNYKELKKQLLIEFGVDVEIKQLEQLYEPTVEEEIRDREILLRNVT
jgi:hypothetical protein